MICKYNNMLRFIFFSLLIFSFSSCIVMTAGYDEVYYSSDDFDENTYIYDSIEIDNNNYSDYEYYSRIRRFNYPSITFRYYSPWYYNSYSYGWNNYYPVTHYYGYGNYWNSYWHSPYFNYWSGYYPYAWNNYHHNHWSYYNSDHLWSIHGWIKSWIWMEYLS